MEPFNIAACGFILIAMLLASINNYQEADFAIKLAIVFAILSR